MRIRPNLTRRPIIDLALVVAVAGLLTVAYVIAGSSWPIDIGGPAAPLTHTSALDPQIANG